MSVSLSLSLLSCENAPAMYLPQANPNKPASYANDHHLPISRFFGTGKLLSKSRIFTTALKRRSTRGPWWTAMKSPKNPSKLWVLHFLRIFGQVHDQNAPGICPAGRATTLLLVDHGWSHDKEHPGSQTGQRKLNPCHVWSLSSMFPHQNLYLVRGFHISWNQRVYIILHYIKILYYIILYYIILYYIILYYIILYYIILYYIIYIYIMIRALSSDYPWIIHASWHLNHQIPTVKLTTIYHSQCPVGDLRDGEVWQQAVVHFRFFLRPAWDFGRRRYRKSWGGKSGGNSEVSEGTSRKIRTNSRNSSGEWCPDSAKSFKPWSEDVIEKRRETTKNRSDLVAGIIQSKSVDSFDPFPRQT